MSSAGDRLRSALLHSETQGGTQTIVECADLRALLEERDNWVRLRDDLADSMPDDWWKLSDENARLKERLSATSKELEHAIKTRTAEWNARVEVARRCDSLKERLARVEGAVRDSVNSECCCGGGGPNDKGTCDACMVWHRFRRALEGE